MRFPKIHEKPMSVARARRAVAINFFALGSAIGLWASRIPDLKQAHNLNEAQFGVLLLVMAFGAVISFPVAGFFVDRNGAANVTKVLSIATLFFVVSLAFASPLWVMGVFVFVTGCCIGSLDVAMNGWGAEVEKAAGRPMMSSFHGIYSLGAGAGAAAGAAALWSHMSLQGHFVLWGAVIAILVVYAVCTKWLAQPAPQMETGAKSPVFVLPKGSLFFVGIMALVAALGEGAITDWAALYQIQELGFEKSQAAIGFAIFSVAMVVMRFAGDGLIARYGAVPIARLSGIAAVFGTLLVVAGTHIWLVWAGCAVMGLGNAVIFPLAMSRAAADQTMSTGAALAAVATLGYGAFLFGPPVLGFIGEAVSLRAAFGLVAVLALLIVFLAGTLKVED